MLLTDASQLDLRGAFDLAIMVEEDAQSRYERLGALLGEDPGGAGDVFRAMALSEARHRAEIEAYRAAVFRAEPPRIHITVLDLGVEHPEVDDGDLPATAREALLMALEAERRSFEFYRDALARVADHAVAYLFRQLMEEETEHVALLAAKLDRLQAAGSAAPARPARARIGPPPGPVPDTARLEAVLQRFDAATQLVVRRVLVEGVAAEVVAASLGVSRRTVTRKLDRFLAAARRELPAAP